MSSVLCEADSYFFILPNPYIEVIVKDRFYFDVYKCVLDGTLGVL